MHISAIGLNHNSAPIHLRERLAFNEENARAALARLGCGTDLCQFSEMVILSTCNRTEIYAVSSRPAFDEMEAFLSEARRVPLADFQSHLYRLFDAEAVDHLLRVAAGLDSLVLGEPQILGQVTHALELSRGQAADGPLLSRLFQTAIHAGKRTRTETAISCNSASISSLAASIAERRTGDLLSAQIVILGAGEMAELAVESLRKRGASNILVINRTLERAQTLASRWSAESSTFEDLDRALLRADILISSTGAPHILIDAGMIAAAMQQRPDRPLVLVDIAVPRDIDPRAASLPHVHLYDIDHLSVQLEQSLAKRSAEVPHVEAILSEEGDEFLDFLSSLDMLPLIADLHEQAEAIRRAELEKTLRRLPDLSEAERIRIEALTQALVKKLLAAPTNRLRSEAASPQAARYATLTRSLFDLPDEHSRHNFSDGSRLYSTGPD